MGWNDHVDWELHERIRGADDLGYFDDQPLALAMAQRVADNLSMSPAQMRVFEQVAWPILARPQNDDERLQAAIDSDREEGMHAVSEREMQMSNQQLDDRMEMERDAAVAKAVGLSLDEYQEAGGWFEPNQSSDGMIYSYTVFFPEDTEAAILAKVTTTELPASFFETPDPDGL